jgi:hypothetical protein
MYLSGLRNASRHQTPRTHASCRPRRDQPSGQQEAKLESESTIDVLNEVQARRDLRRHLVLPAEDVRVVLLEATQACEPTQRSRGLVSDSPQRRRR